MQRRACPLVGVDPKTVRRKRPPDHPEIRQEMKEIAGKRRRFGYPAACQAMPASPRGKDRRAA